MPYKDPEKRRANGAAYRAAHRDEIRARKAAYYIAHRAEILAYHVAYHAAHKEESRAWAAKYYAAHKEESRIYHAAYNVEHRETKLAWQAAYRQTPRGKEAVRAGSRKRNALRRQIAEIDPGRILTSEQWNTILELAKGKCYWCKRVMKKLTQDHVIPLSKGGLHVAENVVASCLSCNLKKHTKIVTLF